MRLKKHTGTSTALITQRNVCAKETRPLDQDW